MCCACGGGDPGFYVTIAESADCFKYENDDSSCQNLMLSGKNIVRFDVDNGPYESRSNQYTVELQADGRFALNNNMILSAGVTASEGPFVFTLNLNTQH